MTESSPNRARTRKRSRRRKKHRSNSFLRFTQSWGKTSEGLAQELFGCEFSGQNRKLQFGLLLVMAVSCAIFIGTTVRPLLASSWSQTQGTLIENKVVELSRRPRRYRRVVQYQFLDRGQVYQGNRIDFSMTYGWAYSSLPEKGKPVTVYFDADHPQNSVLYPRPPWLEVIVSLFVFSLSTFFSGGIIHSAVLRVIGTRRSSEG